MTWQEKVAAGMRLIIEGCNENPNWTDCHTCPFTDLCDSIYKDEESPYSTPDCYEEEGVFEKAE